MDIRLLLLYARLRQLPKLANLVNLLYLGRYNVVLFLQVPMLVVKGQRR